jgi:hypothetical protein
VKNYQINKKKHLCPAFSVSPPGRKPGEKLSN